MRRNSRFAVPARDDSNLVVSADELIPTRFIKSVQIRFRGQKVPATSIGQALDQRAVSLKLEQPLPGAVPLPFTPPMFRPTSHGMPASGCRP